MLAGAPGPAVALVVAADAALACPDLADFRTIRAGGAIPESCVRLVRHEDLYGPVGRAADEPGGPFVRVRQGARLYWAEESAFYPSASGRPGRAAPPPFE